MLRNSIRHFFSKINKELKSNPHFDRAFPDLAKHKEPTTVPSNPTESPFFESLRRHYKHGRSGITDVDKDEMNYRRFVEGFQSTRGPLKYLTSEEIENVDAEVNKKL
jgi:hypothetical protein